ncbi:MAG: AMP-binding protein [Planctomycetes bacterium]|nr:AMP-binding protein [Planctomycetota bacterium]
MSAPSSNVARRLTEQARRMPQHTGVVEPYLLPSSEIAFGKITPGSRHPWRSITLAELNAYSDQLAAGLIARGATPGMRIALLVQPGIDFVALVFALLKARSVAILIDPGMGRSNLVRCLSEARPEGFVAITAAQAVRCLFPWRFRETRLLVTVGRRWFWGGITLEELKSAGMQRIGAGLRLEGNAKDDDPAAIIFTTGSTGPPKGVLYQHGNFDHQVTEIRDRFELQPGGVDVAGFPLFGLFNAAMGIATVFPRMDFTRPAKVDPRNFVAAAVDWQATQSFGSPALWNRVGKYCRDSQVRLDTLRQVFSAGAPVSARVLELVRESIHPAGEVHTPYGATEALPVATISASMVLGETQASTEQGNGVCVGHRFPGIQWRVIRISDEPVPTLADAEPLPAGEIGELIVGGPVVTRQYVTRVEANALAKIADGDRIWHRMGDVGWLDPQGRFWFCGRMAHRVQTAEGTLFSVPCEAIFNTHPSVFRTALIGIGPAGSQRPVIVVEPKPGEMPRRASSRKKLAEELQALGAQHAVTRNIKDFLLHPGLPVDIRHNAKIFREKLVPWGARRLK